RRREAPAPRRADLAPDARRDERGRARLRALARLRLDLARVAGERGVRLAGARARPPGGPLHVHRAGGGRAGRPPRRGRGDRERPGRRAASRGGGGPAGAEAAPPTPAQCERVRASRSVAPVLALDPRPGALRVFAMQFKQDLANVRTYAAFRTKVECMLRDYVVPYLARHRPNVVAFNEDVGLMTLGTGTRGAAARALFADPRLAP